MRSSKLMQKSEVGEVRPSQTLTTFGIGSLIDLPNMSVIVMGLDDWPIVHSSEIGEERLIRSAQDILGTQVKRFLTPPKGPETPGSQTNWFDEARLIGVPVAPFPRWLVCVKCRLLAPLSSSLFDPKVVPYRRDKASYVHNCNTQGKLPTAIPARFMVTCKHGHLDDFPWVEFVHRGPTACVSSLYLHEFGPSGEMADVQVSCDCGVKRRMAEVVGPTRSGMLPPCRGRRPHLRDFDPEGCDETNVRPIALGSSYLWFPVFISALSVPQARDDLGRLIEENWVVLEKATSIEVLKAFRMIGELRELNKYSDESVWDAIQKKITESPKEVDDPNDLKTPEWKVFSNPKEDRFNKNFKLKTVKPPEGFSKQFEKIVLVEKLREVRALVGFSRMLSPREFDKAADLPMENRAKLSRKAPIWLPASETRGEGIFFHFAEEPLQKWVKKHEVYESEFRRGHEAWRKSKNLDPEIGYPGIRFVLLHTFAHAIIRQLAIECGYTSSSITERIYHRDSKEGDPMAGVLIYTAAPDSEGTLGGLCEQGSPAELGRHIRRALEKIAFCAGDPLCSEHKIEDDDKLHGSSCHACSFLPETSCERGNKYLDRSVLVPTLELSELAYFENL